MASKFGGIPVDETTGGSRFGGVAVPDDVQVDTTPIAPVEEPPVTEKMFGLIDKYIKGGRLDPRQMTLIEALSKKKGLGLTYGMKAPETTATTLPEAGLSLASGMLAEPLAGLAGIAQSLNPWAKEDTAVEAVEDVREWLTYMPKDEAAQQIGEQTGELLEPVGETLDAVRTSMGDYAYDLTGDPKMAALAASAPEALAAFLGMRKLGKMKAGTVLKDTSGKPTSALRRFMDEEGLDFDNLPVEVQDAIPTHVQGNLLPFNNPVRPHIKNALVEQLKGGGTENVLARLELDKYGRPVANKAGIEAIKQGFREGQVRPIATANVATKGKMREMTQIMRRITKDESLANKIRPSDVAGQSVVDRIDFINNKKAEAGKELNQIAATELEGVPIDGQKVVTILENELDDLLIDYNREGAPFEIDKKGNPVINFEGSLIEDDVSAKRAFTKIIKYMSRGEQGQPVDALRFHHLKRMTDSLIDSSKKGATGLTGAGDRFLKRMRKGFNDSLREQLPDPSAYASVNDILSTSIDAINDIDNAVGTIDIASVNAQMGIGTKLRSLMSKAQNRQKLVDALAKLDKQSEYLGGYFPEDLSQLAKYADVLDERFGANLTASTSFGGELAKAANQVTQGGARSAGIGIIGKMFKGGADKVRGVSDLNAFEALESLLKEGNQP